ncbi:MAG: hypothetical protein AAF460_16045 [Pseudomonadota bacterium]
MAGVAVRDPRAAKKMRVIEDALKSTRTLYRLVMTVSLVKIVFALSVERCANTALQQALVNGLIGLVNASFVADFIELENSAFLNWVLSQPIDEREVTVLFD